MIVRLPIKLHVNQQAILDHPAKKKVVKAGKRFGKTKLAIYTIIKAAGLQPNGVFWYIAPTYRQAKYIAWDTLNWLLPPEWVERSIENELFKQLTNGAKIQLIGAENEDALRGPPINGFVMDEASYINEQIYPTILAGQMLNSGPHGFEMFISSPNKRGRNWFTNFHADAEKKMKMNDSEWAAFYYTIYDNPTLSRDDIDKVRELNTEDTWNLEYMAIESDFSGILINEFDYKTHVGEYLSNNQMLYVRGIDWGISHPTTCMFLAVDIQNKFVYVFDEFVKSNFLIEESCRAILEKSRGKTFEWTVIDPSTNKRNSQTKFTDRDEFARNGIYCMPGDNRDRGIDIMKMFFKTKRIKIHPQCKNLITEIRNYQRGDKEGDDCLDPLRYALVKIHDTMFGGKNVFESDVFIPKMSNPRQISLYDPLLFPKKEPVTPNWLWHEIND